MLPGMTLAFPEAPGFASVDEERRHRKQRLAAALRLFGKFGYDEGGAGHVTVRDPEHPDMFWVNPFGRAFSQIRVADLLLVDATGKVIEGSRPVNRGAFVIHSAIHEQRPDVVAAAHAHSIHGRALAAMGAPLRPVVQEACAFYGDHAIYDEYNGLALETEEGHRMAARLGGNKAIILQHHGLITVGSTVDEAAYWFVSFDRCAQIQLLADAAGGAKELSHDEASIAHRQFGHAKMGFLGFQVMWDEIVAEQPELLEE